MKQKTLIALRKNILTVCKIQLAFVLIYIAQIITYDASKLITPEIVLGRWIAAAGLATTAILVWYLTKSKATNLTQSQALTWLLILSNIAFATYNVYIQRGMASKALIFFVIPIIISAILLSRAALVSTAILCTIAYTTASVAYFVNYFNEGYKVELYGEILFYSSIFILVSILTWTVSRSRQTS